jgi:hypothetical protein
MHSKQEFSCLSRYINIWNYLFGVPPMLPVQQKGSFYPWHQDLFLSMYFKNQDVQTSSMEVIF